MKEKELEERIGTIEKKVRQHHRMITVNLVVVIMLNISTILILLKVARVLDVLSQIIQMYQDVLALFPGA